METNTPIDSKTRARSITAIAAALILAVGVGYGLRVIAQLGGQTPLGLARGLMEAGVTILGTSPVRMHRLA